jgi:hypothetical protein
VTWRGRRRIWRGCIARLHSGMETLPSSNERWIRMDLVAHFIHSPGAYCTFSTLSSVSSDF